MHTLQTKLVTKYFAFCYFFFLPYYALICCSLFNLLMYVI
jgi:hypothetical protein